MISSMKMPRSILKKFLTWPRGESGWGRFHEEGAIMFQLRSAESPEINQMEEGREQKVWSLGRSIRTMC